MSQDKPLTPEEKVAAVKKTMPQEYKVDLPKMDEPTEELEETPKGKVKALLRKFESSTQKALNKHLLHINKQLDGMHGALHSQLDKKYGGMYKILINTFLTNIESKIYNTEVTVEALKRVLKEELHSIYEDIAKLKEETPITVKEYGEAFDKELAEVRAKVHADVEEAKKEEAQPKKEDSNESKEDEPTPENDTEDSPKTEESNSEVPDSSN